MTIRQLSETAGCNINTVRKVARTMFPEIQAPGKGLPIDYNQDQSVSIMEKLPKKNFIDDPSKISTQAPTTLEGFGESVLVHFMAEMRNQTLDLVRELNRQNQESLKMILKKIDSGDKPSQLLIESNLSPRDQLRAVIAEYTEVNLSGNFREAWHRLYRDLYYIHHVNVKKRSANSGKSKLDIIEDLDLLHQSISIVRGW